MINPFKDVNWHPDTAAKRTFGRSLVIGFPLVTILLLLIAKWNTGAWPAWPLWVGGIGVTVGLLCWVVPSVAKPFYLLWYGLACSIGIVISNVIMAGVYYLAVTPVGLLLRLFGRDPMERRFDRTAASYWKDAEKDVAAKRYFRQF